MALGFFKKLIIADRLSDYVDAAYQFPEMLNGTQAALSLLFFSIQIYTDFSGYSDIARGTAKTLGYELTLNFNLPYLSSNIAEFWNKWHISLSRWFRDYVYIPM
jgi:alginate O-acetyltransferase complex protein AlgI